MNSRFAVISAVIGVVAATTFGPVSSAFAADVVDEWASVKAPPAPALKALKVDPKTTALLVLDMVKPLCNAEKRPRCIASLPKIEKLLADARAHNMTVVYSVFPSSKPEDSLKEIAPRAGEPSVVASTADKFIGTDLEKMLKDKGITTVIVVGTAAHGAVLYTGSGAAMRGFQVIAPVEGMSGVGDDTYAEQASAWLLANAPTIGPKTSVTKMDMISY